MSGEATPSQMGGLLMALRVRGETVDEITGAVSAMRSKMLTVDAPADAVDIVGTGGDGSGSVNVSTCASFIVSGTGLPVAKHGNRALSSRSGAADVLASLGVKIDLRPEQVGRCVRECGIGFMGHHLTTDASIGIALAPEHGTVLDQILKNADMAMYAAKSAGRRTYRFFEPEMDAKVHERRQLEIDLRHAIAHARKNVAKETAKETAMSEQVRNARNALTQPSQPVWPYSGWSAPAGR